MMKIWKFWKIDFLGVLDLSSDEDCSMVPSPVTESVTNHVKNDVTNDTMEAINVQLKNRMSSIQENKSIFDFL